jgi:DNA-directed RNA polymerase specialized sigma24 family protein
LVHSVIAETSDTDDPSDLPPLTRNGYTRLPKTEADIRDLLSLASAAVRLAFIEADETVPGYRNSEALVFFVRRAHRRGEDAVRNGLFGLLTERCQRYFRGAVRGFDPETRKDIQQEVLADLARLTLARENSGDFLESRFLTYLKRETARACGRMRLRFHRAPLIGDMVEDAKAEDVFLANHRHEQQLAEVDRARVREAVEALQQPLRELVLLRYFAGWQIGDERNVARDDERVTLAKKYGVTPRTIQNWLGKAYAEMKKFWKDDQ